MASPAHLSWQNPVEFTIQQLAEPVIGLTGSSSKELVVTFIVPFTQCFRGQKPFLQLFRRFMNE